VSRSRSTTTDGDSAALVPGGGGSPRSAVPVQNTNIVQIIAEHLPGEYGALMAAIGREQEDLQAKLRYKEQLERIAADAGVSLTTTEGPAHGQ
jgi:hypothetical protein